MCHLPPILNNSYYSTFNNLTLATITYVFTEKNWIFKAPYKMVRKSNSGLLCVSCCNWLDKILVFVLGSVDISERKCMY